MKQDLNLIVKKSSDSKKSKTLLYLLLVVVILGALVYLGISIPAGIKNVAIQQKTAVEMQINALASVKDKFAQQMKAQADITQSIALVQELEDNKKDLNQILDYIEKTCPKEVTIFSYKFSPDALELDGYADTDVFLSNFIQGLRQNADFKTVIVKQTQAEALKQKFALTILYAKPLRAEAIKTEADKKEDGTNPEASASPAPSAEPTPTPSAEPTPSPSPEPTPSASPSPSVQPSPSPTPSVSASASPTPSVSASASPSASAKASAKASTKK